MQHATALAAAMTPPVRKTTYLTPAEVAMRYGGRISVRTLANWRWGGTGPRFTRVGGRILYEQNELDTWEAKNTVSHTGEYKK